MRKKSKPIQQKTKQMQRGQDGVYRYIDYEFGSSNDGSLAWRVNLQLKFFFRWLSFLYKYSAEDVYVD